MRTLLSIFIHFVSSVLCTSHQMAEDEPVCLKGAYNSFIANPTAINSANFRKYAHYQYNKSPIACLKYLENNITEWKFNYIFWQSQNEEIEIKVRHMMICDPPEILEMIIDRIKKKFLKIFSGNTETDYKTDLEIISLLSKLAKKTFLYLKSQGYQIDHLIVDIDAQVSIWKFLSERILIDFAHLECKYYSLFSTFEEIRASYLPNHFPKPSSLRLSKLFSLLWVYLYHIWRHDSMDIFDLLHHQTPLICFLILNLNSEFINFYRYYKRAIPPNALERLFENLFNGDGSLNFHFIIKFAERKQSFLDVAPKSNLEAFRYVENRNIYISGRMRRWNLRALAVIELFLLRNGHKVNFK
jgi:hypothetical protein